MPCTFDFNVAATKYFHGVKEGEIPLNLLFSGTVFYASPEGALQVAPISWDKEARFRLPVQVWRDMMDMYYPNWAWLNLRRDVFEKMYAYQGAARDSELGRSDLGPASGRQGDAGAMNTKRVDEIAAAVLYEGYVLYPYRASAVKNRQRWTFGMLYPRAYAEAQSGNDTCRSRTECLVQGGSLARVSARVRFLHLVECEIENQAWQGAMEREVQLEPMSLPRLCGQPVHHPFRFAGESGQKPAEGTVEVTAARLSSNLFRIRVDAINTSSASCSSREEALYWSMVSTHTILGVECGSFVSLLEPPEELREKAAECRNEATWPVLVGEAGERDAMLSSPIILYDYPQIAPESPGALFDATEIDEILTLRIMTLSDDEKRQMGQLDERTRQILERTSAMPPEQFMKLHGVLRAVPPAEKQTHE